MDVETPADLDVIDVTSALLEPGSSWEGASILQADEHSAALQRKNGTVLRLLSGRLPKSGVLPEAISRSVRAVSQNGGEVVVLGGGAEVQSLLAKAKPKFSTRSLRLVQITEDGTALSWPSGINEKDPIVKAVLSAQPVSPERRAELVESADAAAEEHMKFAAALSGRTPWMTFTLLGAIAAVFLLQQLWGEEAILRMGALNPGLVREGEWWRLISAGFLHGGIGHVAANGFVLVILGTQTERLLGAARFLLLYTVSLLGGTLLSMQFLGEGMSVGASGAIWGLLAGQASLAWGRPPLLPSSIALSLRSAAVQNLVLNVLISFVPGIDWAGHLGGGLAGGLALASGAVTWKMHAAGDPPVEGRAKWPRILGAGAAGLLATGVVLALLHGEPWKLSEPIRVVPHSVEELGVRVALPHGTAVSEGRDHDSGAYVVEYGNPARNLAFGTIAFYDRAWGNSPADQEAGMKREAETLEIPDTLEVISPLSETRVGQAPAMFGTYEYKNGVRLQVLMVPTDRWLVRVEAVCVEAHHARCPGPKDLVAPLVD